MKKTILIATCFLLCIGAALAIQGRQVLAADNSGTVSQDQPIDENALFSSETQTQPTNDQKTDTTGNAAPGAGSDQAVDENSLFSSGNTQIVQDQKVLNDNVAAELQQKHIGFSGQVNADTFYTRFSPENDFTGLGGTNRDLFASDIYADLFVDIRLNQGVKGFLSLGVNYYPGGKDDTSYINLDDATTTALHLDPGTKLPITTKKYTDLIIKEFFIDANSKNKYYYRIGKQVLKWGQGYFWNPTDLINVERKDFADMEKVREGTFGAKLSIPNGTQSNIYAFLDMDQASTVNDLSLAGKYEFLVKNTEMSVSARVKNGMAPVFGFDITGRLWNMDYRGEVSLANGANYSLLNYDTLATQDLSGQYIPRVSLGVTKYFSLGDIKDRISVTPEFYYNQAGYDKNIIQRIQNESNSGRKANAKTFYMANYEAYGNSKYYLAVFSSVSKFIISDITLNINGIGNLVDQSGSFSVGIDYQPSMSDISYNAKITNYFGNQFTEATSMGNTFSISFGATIKF